MEGNRVIIATAAGMIFGDVVIQNDDVLPGITQLLCNMSLCD